MTIQDKERKQIKPFATWLREQPGGLHDELGELLAELGLAVVEHRKAGTLNLTVKIAPMPKSDRSIVQSVVDVKLNAPQPDRAVGMFFTDDEGNLHRDDPRQTSFEALISVPNEPDEVVKVDRSTGEVVNLGGSL